MAVGKPVRKHVRYASHRDRVVDSWIRVHGTWMQSRTTLAPGLVVTRTMAVQAELPDGAKYVRCEDARTVRKLPDGVFCVAVADRREDRRSFRRWLERHGLPEADGMLVQALDGVLWYAVHAPADVLRDLEGRPWVRETVLTHGYRAPVHGAGAGELKRR